VIAYFWQCFLLAQAAGDAAAQPAAPGAAANGATGISDGARLMFMILITGILFYFIMLRPQKRKEQELRNKVSSMKENDRVLTIGGIYGVVTNVQRDQQRVTIRVDETTGTKIKVNMSAVARVLTGEDEEGAASGTKS
jgi:preprotein translocase subunit YajC